MSGKASVFTDGGSRGNPGHAGIGVLIELDGVVIHQRAEYIGQTTNNVAEYKAFLYSLSWLCKKSSLINEVTWLLDSLLVVKQLNRQWRVKDPKIFVLAQKAFKVLGSVDFKYQIIHIPRENNTRADALVNQALDDFLKSGRGHF